MVGQKKNNQAHDKHERVRKHPAAETGETG